MRGMPAAVLGISTFLATGDEELLPGFNQEMDATISSALAKDHEDCFGFVLIPNEPWSVVAHSVSILARV